MSAGILEHDRGVVWGTTWHELPQYVQQETAVTFEQAHEVLDYPLEKAQLNYFPTGKYNTLQFAAGAIPVNAWAIIRADTDDVLVPAVGNRFTIVPNVDLLNTVKTQVLDPHPELDIESVGTLWNGQTNFVNVKLQNYVIPGDKSQHISRLMYYNPLGNGSYKVCAHNVRVVCNNTLQFAAGSASETIKIRHTKSAADKIAGAILSLGEIFGAIKQHREHMEHLVNEAISQATINSFLDQYIPCPEEDGPAHTRAIRARIEFTEKFEDGDDALNNTALHSKYGLLQTVTYLLDHEDPVRGNDIASITWDGMVGQRATQKQIALDLIDAL
jgi:phage/plasmid-like protein (TIGR03299 family)